MEPAQHSYHSGQGPLDLFAGDRLEVEVAAELLDLVGAQLGPTDMRLFIQYALTYPERAETPLKDLPIPGVLEFLEPDLKRFPALAVAYEAGRRGGLAQVAVSAADEVAVEAFLQGKIPFPRIPEILARVLEATPTEPLTWESLFAVEAWAREEAKRWA